MTEVDIHYPQLRSLLMQYDHVSFDVFDTLVRRNCASFRSIWRFMEKQADARLGVRTELAHDREAAEIRAYRSGAAAPDLQMIYAYTRYPEKIQQYLIHMEKTTELALIEPNYAVQRIFELCREMGKKVYAVSDTYYPAQFIKSLLDKCGYQVDGIIASCEEGCAKSGGKLFKVLMERYHLNAADVIHFGDNEKADIKGAAKAGITAVRIKNGVHTHYLKKKCAAEGSVSELLYHFVDNRMPFLENRAVRIGYETLGPVVLGMCQWIHAIKQKSGDAALLFCARDAYLLHKWYTALYPEDAGDAKYFYVSLKSLALPYRSASGDEDPQAKEQADYLRRYVRQLTASKKILLVDSGFGGHTQWMLQTILGADYDLHGLYIRMSKQFTERAKRDRSAEAYLFPAAPSPKARISGAFFETMLQAVQGRTLAYRQDEDGTIEAVRGEQSDNGQIMHDVHRGVDRFIQEWVDRDYLHCPIDPCFIQDAFLNFTFFPERADVAYFSSVKGGNSKAVDVIEPCEDAHLHPIAFLRGLQKTYWKGGYLAKAFQDPKCVSHTYLLLDSIILELRGY